MKVATSDLIPGCILFRDVKGKTNRPIIPKNTVLEEIHIQVLKKFLVEQVEVSKTLASGEIYVPKRKEAVQQKKAEETAVQLKERTLPFQARLEEAKEKYKDIFQRLQNHLPLEIGEVRNIILPLLESTEEIDREVYMLHHYTTKEDYIFYHSIAVGITSSFIARKLNFEKKEWMQIGLAGFLSDCGMAKIHPDIVFKEGLLSSEELAQIKKHPTYSYRLVENIPSLSAQVKLAILQHHERMDGSGYPLGLTGDKIHKYARIIAISDMYHAMTSERLYKEKQSPFKVIEEIEQDQFSKLDPEIVRSFIRNLANFSIGTKVRLSNKKNAEIVFIDPNKPTRPMVRFQDSGEIISLQHVPDLYIEEIVSQ